jgi:exopolysaccharide biosynthesis WecB/TagA/CpsF family protein
MNAQSISTDKSALIPAVPRGDDRRCELRDGKDWRVNPRSYNFCGTLFDPVTPIQALARCKWMTTGHSFRYIVTPNVDHVVRLNKEPGLYEPLYEGSWLSVCDSRILELLANFTGIPLKAVPGSDLTAQIFDNVLRPDERINVIGGDEDVIAKVIARYGLTKLKHHQPPMGLRTNPQAVDKCAEFIAKNPARYSFICVGSPQQEMVAKAASDRGDCVGMGLCVGASLDFLAGKVKRAPKWMQLSRLEWLYRLMSEPQRLWKRYLVDSPKIFIIWLKWMLKRDK